jgi:hypothetical protein
MSTPGAAIILAHFACSTAQYPLGVASKIADRFFDTV